MYSFLRCIVHRRARGIFYPMRKIESYQSFAVVFQAAIQSSVQYGDGQLRPDSRRTCFSYMECVGDGDRGESHRNRNGPLPRAHASTLHDCRSAVSVGKGARSLQKMICRRKKSKNILRRALDIPRATNEEGGLGEKRNSATLTLCSSARERVFC